MDVLKRNNKSTTEVLFIIFEENSIKFKYIERYNKYYSQITMFYFWFKPFGSIATDDNLIITSYKLFDVDNDSIEYLHSKIYKE